MLVFFPAVVNFDIGVCMCFPAVPFYSVLRDIVESSQLYDLMRSRCRTSGSVDPNSVGPAAMSMSLNRLADYFSVCNTLCTHL